MIIKNKYKIENKKNYINDYDDQCRIKAKHIYYVIFVLLIFILLIFYRNSVTEKTCLGEKYSKIVCDAVNSHLCTGTLCMDLCIHETIRLGSCVANEEFNSDYRFFQLQESTRESTLICNVKQLEWKDFSFETAYEYPKENIKLIEFEKRITDLIEPRVGYSEKLRKIVENLLDFVDVNRDERISLPEAKTLWSLLNNKNTLYILLLDDPKANYIPKIKSFCGSLIETEPIENYYLFSIKHDSIFPALFPRSYKWSWPEWKYRSKIAMGILEFFLDMPSFNPNDEFGKHSLYLCSPIETSFGHTFTYEAKLLNYKDLLGAYELESVLSDRKCNYDSDCEYTPSCVSKCDVKHQKCTAYLAEPQLVKFCEFIKMYVIEEVKNETDKINIEALNRALDRCFALSQIQRPTLKSYLSLKSYYSFNSTQNTDSSTIIDKINLFSNPQYSIEYSLVAHELKSVLWALIKFTRDPVKPKKDQRTDKMTTTATSATSG